MEQKKNSSNVHGTTTKVVLLPGLEFSDVVVLSTGLSGAYIRFGGAISGSSAKFRSKLLPNNSKLWYNLANN